jgi:hypothetical protein
MAVSAFKEKDGEKEDSQEEGNAFLDLQSAA